MEIKDDHNKGFFSRNNFEASSMSTTQLAYRISRCEDVLDFPQQRNRMPHKFLAYWGWSTSVGGDRGSNTLTWIALHLQNLWGSHFPTMDQVIWYSLHPIHVPFNLIRIGESQMLFYSISFKCQSKNFYILYDLAQKF